MIIIERNENEREEYQRYSLYMRVCASVSVHRQNTGFKLYIVQVPFQ